MRPAALLVALLASSVASCIIPKSCPAVGCSDGAQVPVTTVADLATLAGATLTVCLNDRCSSGALPSASDLRVSGAVSLQGAVHVSTSVDNTSHGFDLTAEVDDSDLHDGDVYTATLTANGATIASTTLTATYHPYYPDGEDCGGACKVATLTP